MIYYVDDQGNLHKSGLDGLDGSDGIDGNDGIDGRDGLSAFQLAQELGFTGTLQEWLASLQGEAGISGINPRGTWNETIDNYVRGDTVRWTNDDGYTHSYWAADDVPVGIPPSNDSYWMLLVMQGATGQRGERGLQGIAGADGGDYGYYVGTDLTVRFADEIDEFGGNPWLWIRARIQDGNFRGINISDYIPFMIGNARIDAQVAGINIYKGSGDVRTPNHIDFIGRDLFNQATQWNFVNFSNGTAANPAPWKSSHIYALLNGLAMGVPDVLPDPETGVRPAPTISNLISTQVDYTETGVFPRLPAELRDVIVEKRAFLPNRFSATAILNNDSGATWQDMGKLWLPSEIEVVGFSQWSGSMAPSTHSHSVRGFIQYPIFTKGMEYRVKGMSHGANPGNWWTLSNQGVNASTVVNINTQGLTNNTQPTSSMRLPICFRIA